MGFERAKPFAEVQEAEPPGVPPTPLTPRIPWNLLDKQALRLYNSTRFVCEVSMRLDVSKALVAEGEAIPFAGEVALPETVILGERVLFPGGAKLTGTYTSIGGTIEVCGEMAFEASARCARCLKTAEKAFVAPFDALFSLTPSEDNPDLYVYDGAWIDPLDMACDTAQLALPMRWICAEECKGLCPVCGADQNLIMCTCRIEGDIKHPFSALQQLLTEDESEV